MVRTSNNGDYEFKGCILPEILALVDIKRGLSLWTGPRSVVESHYESLRKSCKRAGIIDQFNDDLRILRLPGDVTMEEMNWMIRRALIPRRVSIRLNGAL